MTNKHPDAIEVCVKNSIKCLKSWAENQKANMRIDCGCSPEEACYVVHEAMIRWGFSLANDHQFTRHQMELKRK